MTPTTKKIVRNSIDMFKKLSTKDKLNYLSTARKNLRDHKESDYALSYKDTIQAGEIFSRFYFEYEVKERFERAKKEIEENIKNGDIPKDINSFTDLDLFVDANYFGGFFDKEYVVSENHKLENKVQDSINEWLQKR